MAGDRVIVEQAPGPNELLMVAVGFSVGVNTGRSASAICLVVQTCDGCVATPLVARRTVDMPPTRTPWAQILGSTLFGIFGPALPDPMPRRCRNWRPREPRRLGLPGGGGAATPGRRMATGQDRR